ncbi:MAG: 6-carboxytetrahydropterin synthase QueD [Bryobacteraceae bacterium]
MFEVSVTQSFAAAHQLRGYKGKCERLHGHNYRVEVTAAGEKLDGIGLLLDFVHLKAALREVMEPLDHYNLNEVPPFDRINPSAENIAWHICTEVQRRLGEVGRVSQVKVWETDCCVATYRP